MRVVLKPAGIVIVLSTIALLLWLVVSDQARLLFTPTGAPKTTEFREMRAPATPTPLVPGGANAAGTTNGRTFRAVDLTRIGATDWTIYGVIPGVLPAQSLVRKAIASPRIMTAEFAGKGNVSSYGNDARAFRWSDGAGPNRTGDGVATGVVTAGVGTGFRIVVLPTVGKRQTLKVWVGGAGIRSKLIARMSDGSPLSQVIESYDPIDGGNVRAFRSLYTIYFRASKPDQKLILSYLVAEEGKRGAGAQASERNSVSLQSVALD